MSSSWRNSAWKEQSLSLIFAKGGCGKERIEFRCERCFHSEASGLRVAQKKINAPLLATKEVYWVSPDASQAPHTDFFYSSPTYRCHILACHSASVLLQPHGSGVIPHWIAAPFFRLPALGSPQLAIQSYVNNATPLVVPFTPSHMRDDAQYREPTVSFTVLLTRDNPPRESPSLRTASSSAKQEDLKGRS